MAEDKTPPSDSAGTPEEKPAKPATTAEPQAAPTAAAPTEPTAAPPEEVPASTSVEPAPQPVEPATVETARDMPPSSDLAAAKYVFPKMHPEGTKFVVAAAALAVLFWILGWEILGWLTAGLAVWIFAFFRDPDRVTPDGDDKIVSPADGLVSHIVKVPPPRQLAAKGLLEAESYTRVSVFMSVFDVHVNRAPATGKISRIVYVPGKFVNAEMDKASEDNERQYFVIEKADGTVIGMTQIAGLVARRIVKFVREGQGVGAGERIGLIRFGSRCDVFLPADYTPAVAIGQRAVAGETVLAVKGGNAVTGTTR